MNLFKNLLFLHGHFVRAEDVESTGTEEASPASADALADRRQRDSRPMHAGHDFDITERFDATRAPASARQECATCA